MKDKPYFAKYLPIEGEIKVGEKYINLVFGLTEPYKEGGEHKGNYSTCEDRVVETRTKYQNNDMAFNGSKHSMKKKVKLFLCTRAIQVGDKIKFQAGNEWFEDEVINILESLPERYALKNPDLSWISKELAFKVIGEISEGAIWVKEGMEFDEEDLSFYVSSHHSEQSYSMTLNGFFDCNWQGEKYIKVKCPTCGHFH